MKNSLKKAPNLLSEEELLNALENNSLSKEVTVKEDVNDYSSLQDDVLLFISKFDLKPGNEFVTKKLIYKVYKAWSKNPLDEHNFNLKSGLFFPHSDTRYEVNQTAVHLAYTVYKQHRKTQVTSRRKSIRWKQHFDHFIHVHEIKSGDFWIESRVLYFLYDKWCFNHLKERKSILSYKDFKSFLKVYFEYKVKGLGKSEWFRLDKSIKKQFKAGQIEELYEGFVKKEKEKPERKKAKKTKNKKKRIGIS